MSELYLPTSHNGPRPRREGVLIGVITGDLARYTDFMTSLIGVMGTVPPGSGMSVAKGVDVPGNCNALCRHMLAGNYAYIWLMGDDHIMDRDMVLRLLEHDADVIVPHCLKRYPPWSAVVYSHQNEDGDYVKANLPETGPVEIHAAGSAGMLIRRNVIEALADPWFQPSPNSEGLNEDLYFCEKVREAGFTILCDPAVLLGHISLHTVRPIWDGNAWQTSVDHDTIVTVTYRGEQVEPVEEPEPLRQYATAYDSFNEREAIA